MPLDNLFGKDTPHVHTVVIDQAVSPTCTQAGLTEGEHCSVCSEILVEQMTVDALGHIVIVDEAVRATCTKSGLTEGEHCSACGEILVEQMIVDALGHMVIVDEAVAATCVEGGLTEGAHCAMCGNILVEQTIIYPLGHLTVVDEAVPATCISTGLTQGKHCSVCNEILVAQQVIPITSHTVVVDETVDPTCTNTGLTEGEHCSVCGKVFVEQSIIPILTHKYDGKNDESCNECDHNRDITCAHAQIVVIAGEASTCLNVGYTDGERCEDCGELLVAQQIIPTVTHKYSDSHDEICNECQEERDVNCDHANIVVVTGKYPTCTGVGYTDGEKCSDCGELIVAQQMIPQITHTYNDINDAGCSKCEHERDIDCIHAHIAIISGQVATCARHGYTDGAKCKDCGELFIPQKIIPMKPHTYDDETDESCNECGFVRYIGCRHTTTIIFTGYSANCVSDGLADGVYCTECNEIIVAQTVIDALGHIGADSVVENNIESTCIAQGSYDVVVYCSRCGEEISRETVIIAVIDHNYVDGSCSACGKYLGYIRDGDYIYFGEYPQSLKAVDVTITDVQDSRGYYLGSDNFYYAKVIATSNTNVSFSTGATVSDGAVYYFKVEPIRWRILTVDGANALILCDSIIANMSYQSNCEFMQVNAFKGDCTTGNGAPKLTYANTYEYSDVRVWLNQTFYENAFSELQKEIILTTKVDNSWRSSDSTSASLNAYTCRDTDDKVFILSYKEATSFSLGFSAYSVSDTARKLGVSDYAIANGANCYEGFGVWWLRSPYVRRFAHSGSFYYGGKYVHGVSTYGYLFENALNVTNTRIGVVPAMWITL